MTPWQIAKDSELSQQQAFFCWCNKAQEIGFKLAWEECAYFGKTVYVDSALPIPELAWIHAVPNGVRTGSSTARIKEGSALKAAGVKAGVLDICWILARLDFGGLCIEMKAPSVKQKKNEYAGLSPEQTLYGKYLIEQYFKPVLCYSWIEAAKAVEDYYNLPRS